ncbi:hypothetical protein CBM2634_U540003 [Cupriavidus taiwanensis]|uniref:Uncharacterized protein n=1 Tax=Cupriavidus taiwanensis TaxID=164546 RepID=A0A375JCZ1_9BURK|nr:hypothetical protein CBM2634_U540003 [Cupriavidus taiwanensis]
MRKRDPSLRRRSQGLALCQHRRRRARQRQSLFVGRDSEGQLHRCVPLSGLAVHQVAAGHDCRRLCSALDLGHAEATLRGVVKELLTIISSGRLPFGQASLGVVPNKRQINGRFEYTLHLLVSR